MPEVPSLWAKLILGSDPPEARPVAFVVSNDPIVFCQEGGQVLRRVAYAWRPHFAVVPVLVGFPGRNLGMPCCRHSPDSPPSGKYVYKLVHYDTTHYNTLTTMMTRTCLTLLETEDPRVVATYTTANSSMCACTAFHSVTRRPYFCVGREHCILENLTRF